MLHSIDVWASSLTKKRALPPASPLAALKVVLQSTTWTHRILKTTSPSNVIDQTAQQAAYRTSTLWVTLLIAICRYHHRQCRSTLVSVFACSIYILFLTSLQLLTFIVGGSGPAWFLGRFCFTFCLILFNIIRSIIYLCYSLEPLSCAFFSTTTHMENNKFLVPRL